MATTPIPLAMETPAGPASESPGVGRRGMVADAIEAGVLSGRLWLYSNYHCNLACTYCLTDSAPSAPARELGRDRMLALAGEATAMGFTGIGITGGEPFLLPYLPDVVTELAHALPVTVLSNGTLLTGRRLQRLAPWEGLPVRIQVSLDRPDPIANDAMRGPDNFRRVVEAVPRLIRMGIGVRVATTVEDMDEEEMARLCALHRRLGVQEGDHIVRPIVRRGRALVEGLGTVVGLIDLQPELTITADGAFWSPFGPTVAGGRLETDLLVTKEIIPLRVPAEALVRMARNRPVREGDEERFK